MRNKWKLFPWLASLVGCATPPPASELVSFHYSVNGMARFSGAGYVLRRGEAGAVEVILDAEFPTERRITGVEPGALAELQAIAERHGMHRYHGYYTPKFNVLDGETWSFSMSYADGSSVSAGGHESYPRGGGAAFNDVKQFFSRWRAPDSPTNP